MSFDALVVHLADAVTLRRMHAPGLVAVVLIDGFGCCGKSTLAQALALRTDAVILETDEFQQPSAGVIEHDSPLSYRRWFALEAAATALAQGHGARYAPIDWETHRLQSEVEVAPKATLIIDHRCGSLSTGSLSPACNGSRRETALTWRTGTGTSRSSWRTSGGSRHGKRRTCTSWAPS